MPDQQPFQAWAVVELFGHQKIAGQVSEESIAGASFLRVDVPQLGENPPYTRFFGAAAIYGISPCSEQIARAAAIQYNQRPVVIYHQSVITALPSPDYDEDDEDDNLSPEVPF